jgi:acyl-CoA thioesterase FadM
MEPGALVTTEGEARPEWIDYNGHLMDGYYAVAFSAVTDHFLELVGFGPAYPAASGHSVYTVESHLVYLREVRAGARLVYTTQLLGYDERRIHLVHTMAVAGAPAATNELLLVHVRQEPPGVVPMPAAALARLAEFARAHAAHAPPAQVGRRVGLRRG